MRERQETITAPDGQTFGAHLAVPDAGGGPGLLVLQEIFGVNDYIRDVCRRLAEVGYVAMAPDVFWRLEPGLDLPHDEAGLQKAYEYVTRYDWEQGIPDLVAALRHLRSLPETDGRAGALGFCFGGTTSFALARRRPRRRRQLLRLGGTGLVYPRGGRDRADAVALRRVRRVHSE